MNPLSPENIIQLTTQGYLILDIPIDTSTTTTKFEKWHQQVNPTIPAHGVISHYQIGHQEFLWEIRTHPSIQAPFQQLYKTKDLLVSFDGIGYIPPTLSRRDTNWYHSDQSPTDKNFKAYQSLLSLTNNHQRVFLCFPGSHLLLQSYYQSYPPSNNKRFQKLPHYQTFSKQTPIAIPLQKNQLLIWDSRLVHSNRYGTPGETRLVFYISFLPKASITPNQLAKRHKNFLEKRTTSHWAYPQQTNSLQPQIWGNQSLLINYSTLPTIHYSQDLITKINKIL